MSSKIIIGVMGPGEGATPEQNEMAFELGQSIGKQGWITLTGGRSFGIMDAVMKGAHDADGLTIGILPTDTEAGASEHADIRIVTGMNSGRNYINILSSHVVVAIGMTAGTASEVALALKANKKVILVNQDETTVQFFKNIGSYKILVAKNVAETITHIKGYLEVQKRG